MKALGGGDSKPQPNIYMGTGKCSPRASRVTMLACRFVVISIAVASAKQLGWAGNFAEEGGACW